MSIPRFIAFHVVLFLPSVYMVGQTASPGPTSSCPSVAQPYKGIAPRERFKWVARSAVGLESLAGGVFSAGIGTATNSPREYHGTWEGFGKRYGMRLTGVATGNLIEAGLGSLWGEDPRYFRAAGEPFGGRVRNVIIKTFTARRPSGFYAPAYARYAAIAGNNFLSNTWRPDSEADTQHAALRTLWGLLSRMGGNAFREFWPDVQQRIFHRHVIDCP